MDRLGDEELIAEIVPDFLANDIDYVGDLKAALSSGDPTQMRQQAHSLKGASASIGAETLSQKARSLEENAKAGSLEGAEALIDQVQVELDKLKELLAHPNWMDLAKSS